MARNKTSPRITAGRYKSIRIETVDHLECKPTTDYAKQVLFNWLGDDISGSRVLDLFAGSGSLGIESLSRSATHVDFVESNAQMYLCLQKNCRRVIAEDNSCTTYNLDALEFCNTSNQLYNIVLLDPPYSKVAQTSMLLQLLLDRQRLLPDALVYIEQSQLEDTVEIPKARLVKSKKKFATLQSLWLIENQT